ncbi:MAG: ATP-binding protein [Thermodesulfobacteriota bacterium]
MPDNWSIKKLLGQHPSRPFNPTVANAFFRAGEIEAWGRGIQRVFDACREAGTPEPHVQVEPGELWFEFPFSPAYLDSILSGKTTHETTQETPVKTPAKTPERILDAVGANPCMTLAEVADTIGKSLSAVERASAKLVREGRLHYVGSHKGGFPYTPAHLKRVLMVSSHPIIISPHQAGPYRSGSGYLHA